MKTITSIVCWHCKRGNVTLSRVIKEEGKLSRRKTEDYICKECWANGFYLPPIFNASRSNRYIPEKEDIEKILAMEAEKKKNDKK